MPKVYWSILNTVLNNKEIPNIPPLNGNGKIISNCEKNEILQFTVSLSMYSN